MALQNVHKIWIHWFLLCTFTAMRSKSLWIQHYVIFTIQFRLVILQGYRGIVIFADWKPMRSCFLLLLSVHFPLTNNNRAIPWLENKHSKMHLQLDQIYDSVQQSKFIFHKFSALNLNMILFVSTEYSDWWISYWARELNSAVLVKKRFSESVIVPFAETVRSFWQNFFSAERPLFRTKTIDVWILLSTVRIDLAIRSDVQLYTCIKSRCIG